MRGSRRCEILVPTGVALTTVTFGSVAGVPALASVPALLAAAAGIASGIAKRGRDKSEPAYAVVLADGSVPPRPSQRSVSSLEDFAIHSVDVLAERTIESSRSE